MRDTAVPSVRPMRRARALRGSILVTALAFAAEGRAQDGADAARRALIDEASAAARAGDHPRALELATRASAIRATPSLRYFLAREHLSLGHPVEALALAGECATGARGDPSVNRRDALIARCEAISSEAERSVARLTVRVPSPAPEGLRVTVAGAPLPPSLYDVAVPIAPALVAVTAAAEGREPFEASVPLTAGAREELLLRLPEVPRSVEPPPPPTPAPRAAPVPPPRPRPRRPVPPPALGPGPWVVAGVGGAALAVGAVLGVVSLDARDSRDTVCPQAAGCDRAAAATFDGRYRDAALGANVAFGVGAALLAGAATWWAVARATRRPVAVAFGPAALTIRW